MKLDAEFFRGDGGDGRGEIVISEALQLAKKLHMRTVAEGVEAREQVDFLAEKGCDMIQGYYYSKPLPKSEYEKCLRKLKENDAEEEEREETEAQEKETAKEDSEEGKPDEALSGEDTPGGEVSEKPDAADSEETPKQEEPEAETKETDAGPENARSDTEASADTNKAEEEKPKETVSAEEKADPLVPDPEPEKAPDAVSSQ